MKSTCSIRSLLHCTTLALFAALGGVVNAQTYYISEVSGNDANAGTSGSPWKTIAGMHSHIGPLTSGETVKLVAGGVYPGTIQVDGGSTNVVIEADGVGTAPVISGSIPVTGWLHHTGTIWKAVVPTATRIGHVYKDNILQEIARYPNPDAPDNGWLRNTKHRNNTDMVGPIPCDRLARVGVVPATGLIGATAVVRTTNWSYNLDTIVGNVGADTLLITALGYSMGTYQWGHYFRNKYAFIDQAGEWFQGPGSGGSDTLYYQSTSSVVAPTGVRMGIHARGINIGALSSGITVRNIAFKHQTEFGVASYRCTNVSVRQCSFQHLYVGIKDDSADPANTKHRYSNNSFQYTYDRAIRSDADSVRIDSNLFADIATVVGLGESSWGYQGLRAAGSGIAIRNNTFRNVGYTALEMKGSGVVSNNSITNALAILNDGGGIAFDQTNGMDIHHNIINGLGDPLVNLISSAANYHAYRQISYGIYFGDNSITNTTVHHNTVSGCMAGIHVDHTLASTGIEVKDNTLFNNDTQLSMSDFSNYRAWDGGNGSQGNQGSGNSNYTAAYDDKYTGNILYCLTENQRCMEQTHTWPSSYNARVDFGDFDNNYYFNPFNELTIWLNMKASSFNNAWQTLPRTLDRWRSDNAALFYDVSSNASPLRLQRYTTAPSSPPLELVVTHDFNSGLGDWIVGSCPPTLGTLDGSPAMRSAGCTWIDEERLSAPAPVNGQYLLRCDVKGTLNGILKVSGILTMDENPPGTWISFGTTTRHIETLVDINTTGLSLGVPRSATYFRDVEAQSGIQSDTVLYDNVYLTKVDVTYDDAQVALDHILRYNNPLTDGLSDPQDVETFELAGCWADVFGNIHSGTVTLDPWESIVLYKVDGVFAIDQPNNATPYSITTNTTWNTNMNVRGSVHVEEGATLTIDGARIGFAVSTPLLTTNLVVKPGGTLIVQNHAHLTTALACEGQGMWNGIQVLSMSPSMGVVKEGKAYFTSGATISDAYAGVMAGNGDFNSNTFTIRGGRIKAEDAIFKNNVYGVLVKSSAIDFFAFYAGQTIPASYIAMEPEFTRCTFRTTVALRDPVQTPRAHLKVVRRASAKILGCSFSNDLPTHTSSKAMGHGIEVFSSAFHVVPTAGPNPQGNTFRNLDHGIHFTGSSGSYWSYVQGSTFTDNICGVFASGLIGAYITSNNFQMGGWNDVTMDNLDEFHWDSHHRGIFTTRSYATAIRDNVFTRTPGNSTKLEGIVVGYTGAHNEVVWRNEATDMDNGFVGEGISADVDGGNAMNLGLQFHCNLNNGNEINLTSRMAEGDPNNQNQHTIRGNQGSSTLSASNRFDRVAGLTDYRKTTTYLPVINYYHSGLNSNSNIFRPRYINGSITRIAGATANGCTRPPGLEGLPGGGPVAEMEINLLNERTAYGEVRYLHDQLVDGGSTDEVVDEIIGSWPNEVWELRSSLLSKSPYLSVEALKELVLKQSVPQAIIAEICIANPEATQKDDFVRWAEYVASPPLPGHIIQSIMASWNTRTYRSTLEEQLGDHHTAMTQIAHELLMRYEQEEPAPGRSALWVWQQIRTTPARFAEARMLLTAGDHAGAMAVIEAMPQEKQLRAQEENERGRMLTYLQVLATAHAQGRSESYLNASEVNTLELLVGDHYDLPAVWASNLLCADHGKCRAPFTGGTGEGTPKRAEMPEAAGPDAGPMLLLHPNPATTWVSIQHRIPGHSGAVHLVVRDAQGRPVQQLRSAASEGQLVLDTRALAPAVYTVELVTTGAPLLTQRLVVQP